MYRLKSYDLSVYMEAGSFSSEILHVPLRQKPNQTSSDQVKKIKFGNLTKEQIQVLEEEVNCLSKIDHPQIVPTTGVVWETQSSSLLVQLAVSKGTDLSKLIENSKQSGVLLDENVIWKGMVEVCTGVEWLHSRLSKFRLLQVDIRPSNVYIDGGGSFRLALFGFVRTSTLKDRTSLSSKGAPHYISPEMLTGRAVDNKSDIWALGCLVYEMCCLVPPFMGANSHIRNNRIKSGRVNASLPECYSNDLWEVIRFLLVVNCESRPTAEMVLYHPLVFINFHAFDVRTTLRKEAKKNNIKEYNTKTFNEVLHDIQNVSISQRDPEEISEAVFKEKWQSCLESLRQKEDDVKCREAGMRDREEALRLWEQSLSHKEKYLKLLERKTQEKLTFVELSRRRRKEKLSESFFDNATDISADLGESEELMTTSAKLDPKYVLRPKFTSCTVEKHVHFQDGQKENKTSSGGSSASSHKSKESIRSTESCLKVIKSLKGCDRIHSLPKNNTIHFL